MSNKHIIDTSDRILITGSNGFIGNRVVESLMSLGFKNLRCFVRPASDPSVLEEIASRYDGVRMEIFRGNLLSKEDCRNACHDVSLIYHLAASAEKSFPGSVMNCLVTSRNILDAAVDSGGVKRFLNVGSFAVYSNFKMKRRSLLNETCDTETKFVERDEPYVYAKMKQDELMEKYEQEYGLKYVTVRPGVVYGPEQVSLSPRVGIDTFGIFLHLGGRNRVPLTYVDNCADAIVLSGLVEGIDGSIYNIVDDDLPTSRSFLRMFKKNHGHFRSIYIPYRMFYFLCFLWERYSKRSKNQLPPVFNRLRCSAYWRGNKYSNDKLKSEVGWEPKVSYNMASQQYSEFLRRAGGEN